MIQITSLKYILFLILLDMTHKTLSLTLCKHFEII